MVDVGLGSRVVLVKRTKGFRMRQIFGVVRSSRGEEKNSTIMASKNERLREKSRSLKRKYQPKKAQLKN